MKKGSFWHVLIGAGVLLLAFAGPGMAQPPHLDAFRNAYGWITGSELDDCIVCHDMATMARNPYGLDFESALPATGNDADSALRSIDYLDSDGDGYGNFDEILNWTFPGDPGDYYLSDCIDNDNDGSARADSPEYCSMVMYIDCNDDDPLINPEVDEVCDDGVDNNCDGYVDCQDSACASAPNCLICTDLDEDGYAIEGGDCGPIDCNDDDVAVHPGAIENCSDLIDNDCDDLIDCTDADCTGQPACESACIPESSREKGKKCSDGIDNDCDGLLDGNDPDC